MASLYFDYSYKGSVAQTTEITVLGEEDSGMNADATIVVNVAPADMANLLTVSFNAGETGVPGTYPTVTLDWTQIAKSANRVYANWVSMGEAGGAPKSSFVDDSGISAASDTTKAKGLQDLFSSYGFTYTANADSPLNLIPPEAVKSVDYSSAITVTSPVNGAAVQLIAGADANGLIGDSLVPVVCDGAAAYDAGSETGAVRSLYLQALAAGRITQATTPSASGNDVPAPGQALFDPKEGDTITVYTPLSLTKTRHFLPDTVSDVAQPGSFKFMVDGTDGLVIDSSGQTLASDPKLYTVAWQFNVTAALGQSSAV